MKKLYKNFDIKAFLDDEGVEYWEHGKNVGKDYIGIQCVFPTCTDTSNHLGINLKHKGFKCLACEETGSLSVLLKQILHIKSIWYDFIPLLQKYQLDDYYIEDKPKKKKRKKSKILPPEFEYLKKKKLPPLVYNMLRDRKLSLRIIKKYSLGWCQFGDYPLHLIAPIFYNDEIVSYMAMDLTGKTSPKYQICPNDVSHIIKDDILYGVDGLSKDMEQLFICEGLVDKWKLGKEAIAFFGKRFTANQLYSITERVSPKTIVKIILDSDAKKEADILSLNLPAYFKNIFVVSLKKGDPANLSKKEISRIKEVEA